MLFLLNSLVVCLLCFYDGSKTRYQIDCNQLTAIQVSAVAIRAAPILPAKILEAKSKEQNARKIGENR